MVDIPTVVSIHLGDVGARLLPERDDLVTLQSEQEFMSQGVPRLVAWLISRNPLH